MSSMESFIRGLPKAELHVHVEGCLEPELCFALARRNHVEIGYRSVEELRAAYRFTDLRSFLDVYYAAAAALVTEQDFHDLTSAYLRRAHEDHVRHAEIFFDPQTHTGRGVPFEAVVTGVHGALEAGRDRWGVTSRLVLCFLRDRSEEEAMETLSRALPFRDWIVGVGLDSSEVGHPPKDFARVFARARSEGFHVVAHAGEEGPPDYVWQALDRLGAERIDHGVRALEDPALVERLARARVPLTVCPLSNVALGVFPSIEAHTLKRLLDAGLTVTINSDDPAYFGGYVTDNYLAVQQALRLTREDVLRLAENAFTASFLSEEERLTLLRELRAYATAA